MFRVRVSGIESIKDLDGNLGKRIDLVEDKEIAPCPFGGMRRGSEEATIVSGVMQGLQTMMPVQILPKTMPFPKIILFLTEHECEALAIQFGVNKVFEVTLEEQCIKFKREGAIKES